MEFKIRFFYFSNKILINRSENASVVSKWKVCTIKRVEGCKANLRFLILKN